MTAQDLIYQALRKCGQMRPGYTNSADLLNDGLLEFQAVYDGWNARRTNAFSIPDYIYPIGSSVGIRGIYGNNVQFTIGPSFSFLGALTMGSPVVTVTSTQGLIIGQPVTNASLPTGAYITGFSVNTSVTLSQNATADDPAATITVPPIFAGPRPEAILRMNLYMTSVSPSQPTRIPLSAISAEEFANISVIQLMPINVTTVFYYDPQFPQGVINVWPPLNGNSLELFTWGFLTPPVSLSTPMLVPPGYQDAIVWTLAMRLYHLCTNDVMPHKVSHQWLCGQAMLAQKRVRDVNSPMPRMGSDYRGGHGASTGVCDWSLLLAGVPY